MDDSKQSDLLASFHYSVMDDELSSQVGKAQFGAPFGERKKTMITTKRLVIVCVIFTTVILIGFATGCIALLAEKRSPKTEVPDQEQIYLRQDELWQNASEILSKKIEMLRNETNEHFKIVRQDDLWRNMSETMNARLNLLKSEINEIVASSSQSSLQDQYLQQKQLWQNASDTLSKKIDLLRNETNTNIKLSRQDDLWQNVSDTLSTNFNLLKTKINSVVADQNLRQDRLWQDATEILSKKIDLLRNETDEHFEKARLSQLQDELIEESDIYVASNRVYRLYKSPKSFKDAKKKCESIDAMLVSVVIRNSRNNSELLRFVKKMVLPGNSETECTTCLWVGLSYSTLNRAWMWSDGISDDTSINWGPGQPSLRHQGQGEDCAVLYIGNGEIHDYSCDKKFYYLCEMSEISQSN